MLKIFQWIFHPKRTQAINRILKKGEHEIENNKVFLEYFKWQREHAPEDAEEKKLAELDLKIKQTEDVLKNNIVADISFKTFANNS